MARWSITIHFTDGTYRNMVACENKDRAYQLGLMDARMASSFGNFYGDVLGWRADREILSVEDLDAALRQIEVDYGMVG